MLTPEQETVLITAAHKVLSVLNRCSTPSIYQEAAGPLTKALDEIEEGRLARAAWAVVNTYRDSYMRPELKDLEDILNEKR